MRRSIQSAVIIGFGALLVLSAPARGAGSGRQTIIQGVRDDVRRKIQGSTAGPTLGHARQWHHVESPHRRR